MTLFEISSILFTAAALGSFINQKWIKLPPAIALMLFAMLAGVLGIVLRSTDLIAITPIENFLKHINFTTLIFHGMLSFLLFAGALQINIEELKKYKLTVAMTATVSTLISAILIGCLFYFVANFLGFHSINLMIALLFGAIVSPTDPIAVMGIIHKMNVPKNIEIKIAGESLFNDGVAIVFFIIILQLMNSAADVNSLKIIGLLLQAIGGGVLTGYVLGWIAKKLLAQINFPQTELLITLALTTAGYIVAEMLQVSAPLAMVVAGIMVGEHHRNKAKTNNEQNYVTFFWLLIEEILNAVLFILIGLEMMVLKIQGLGTILAISCIFIALIARYISVVVPLQLIKPFYGLSKGTSILMTWGGLRGALSIALVLSLTPISIREILLPCVYFIVVFSIVFQGLTLGKLLKIYGFSAKKT